jgi:hypothetical protein
MTTRLLFILLAVVSCKVQTSKNVTPIQSTTIKTLGFDESFLSQGDNEFIAYADALFQGIVQNCEKSFSLNSTGNYNELEKD